MGARLRVEVLDRDRARPTGSLDVHGGVEHRERDAHVRGVSGDASIADPQHGVHPRLALERRAPRACRPLVALRHADVAKVSAAGSLEEVSADRRHVADLRRRARQQRLRQHGRAGDDLRVVREVAVFHERADPEAASGQLFDRGPVERVHVDEPFGVLDPQPQEIDHAGAAGDEQRVRGARGRHHSRAVGRSHVRERPHVCTVFRASWIADTMFG